MNNLTELGNSMLQDNRTGSSSHTLKYQSSLKTDQNISIKTKEGDIVTISLNSRSNEELYAYDYASGLRKEAGRQYSSSESSSLSISVNGDLNEEEQKEIDEIIKKTDSLMQNLINGDMDALQDGVQNILKEGGTIAELKAKLMYQQQTYAEEKVTLKNTYINDDLFKEVVDAVSKNIKDLIEHSNVESKKSVPAVSEYLKELSENLDIDNPFHNLHEKAVKSVREQIGNILN